MEKPNVYSHILKSTIVFGGMQGFNVLIGLLRTKFVALFIGPAGMGLVALFTSTIKLLGDITNLGLPVSAVRELSKAYEDIDSSLLERLVSVFRRWTLCTALLGMVLCILLSSVISQLAFSSSEYMWHIVMLSPAVAFATLAAGETALLNTQADQVICIQSHGLARYHGSALLFLWYAWCCSRACACGIGTGRHRPILFFP